MKLTVIGGAGFLGRALIGRLTETGGRVEVVSLDRSPYPEKAARPAEFTHLVGSAADASLLLKVLAGADAVWIRAGLLGGPQSVRTETCADYLRENTDMVAAVLTACGETGCRRVFYDSSEQVFGNEFDPESNAPDSEPVSRNFYGASKLIAEKLLRAWAFADDAAPRSVQIFRYPRVRSSDSRDPVFHMADAALSGRPIRVIGDPGHAIDFVHIEDVTAANIAALSRTPRFAVYHVSSGRPIALLDLARRIQELATGASRPKVEIEKIPSEPGLAFEPRTVGLSWEDSIRELGLAAPKPLDTMIQETIAWLQEKK